MLIRESLIYLQHSPLNCLSCTGPIGMQYSISCMNIYKSRAGKRKIHAIYTAIILVMLFTSLYLIGFMIVLFGPPFEIPSSSFGCTRSFVGFGGLWGELPLLLLVLKGMQTWGLSLLLNSGVCTLGVPKFTLDAFDGTCNFSSDITLHCNINPFCQYLAPSWVDTQ